MTFLNRLYIYFRRHLFKFLRINLSQISFKNPRLERVIRIEQDYSFTVDETFAHVQSGVSFVELGNSMFMLDESTGWHPIVAQNYFGYLPKDKRRFRTLDNQIIIANPRNYFHWFTEELIRYLNADPSLSYIAHESLPKYARNSLKDLNLKIDFINDSWVNIKNQRIYTREPFELLLSTTKYAVLSSYVLPSIDKCSCHEAIDFQRAYISRKFSKRPLPDEEKIEDLFRQARYEILYFEECEFDCQVTIIQQIDVLAGAHGAGLTNMLWLKTGSKVVEVMPPDFFNPCYSQLAKNLNLQYESIDLLDEDAISLLKESLVNDQ